MFAYCENNPTNFNDPSGSLKERNTYNTIHEGCGGASGGYVGGWILLGLLQAYEEVREAIDNATLSVAISADPPIGDYTVYFLAAEGDPSQSIVYVGRVKTSNFDARMSYHRTRGRRFVNSISGLDYDTCRVIEQGGMVYYHTINKESTKHNRIRGIGPTNKKKYQYMAAIWDLVNSSLYPDNTLLPLSFWENMTEEQLLNMGT